MTGLVTDPAAGPADHATLACWTGYNGRPVLFPDEGGLVPWIAKAVEAHPDRPAVRAPDRSLTYRELDERSDAVAAFLRHAGVRPGSIVAVASSRTAAPYAGILGALKAGCGYVPVDPADPPDRLRFILADANAAAVLGRSAEAGSLHDAAGQVGVRAVLDDGAPPAPGWAALDRWTARDRPRQAEPLPAPDPGRAGRTAYVVYTSGTTGRPKGVRIGEASVVNLVHWVVTQHGVRAHDRLAQAAPLTFDPSVQQVFPAWVTGACLVPVPEPELLDPAAMLAWLRRERITHLDVVTPHWQQLRTAAEDTPEPCQLPDLRWIIIGGETLHYEQSHRWHRAVSSPALLDNIYGPTEATVNATWVVVDPARAAGQVPIGAPLPNYRLYAVDDHGRLCRPGETGEILIAGAGLAQRYQSAEATARAFGELALPDGTRERVYRTGDLGRLIGTAATGWTLEFRGRRDTQVKLRGFRIELDEVEAAVKACPAVRDAAVLVRSHPAEQLVCCYAADAGATPAEVRRFLAGRLAAHQLPNLFLRLDELPLTRNGKLDRQALARWTAAALARRAPEGRPPAGDLERLVAEVWCEVLGVGAVAADEDFFTVGGTSLLAVAVVSRLRARGVTAGPADLFNHPTVARLAAFVGAAASSMTTESGAR